MKMLNNYILMPKLYLIPSRKDFKDISFVLKTSYFIAEYNAIYLKSYYFHLFSLNISKFKEYADDIYDNTEIPF